MQQVLAKLIITDRMFEGLGEVSFITSHCDIKISWSPLLVLSLPTKFDNEKYGESNENNNVIHGDKYYGICAECLL